MDVKQKRGFLGRAFVEYVNMYCYKRTNCTVPLFTSPICNI